MCSINFIFAKLGSFTLLTCMLDCILLSILFLIIPGDLLDEGKWCDDEEFLNHVERFNTMFSVPSGTQRHVVVGNHDVGFHYM